MAAEKVAVASGADHGEGLRKRTVQSPQTPPQITVQPVDDKKLAKKVSIACWTFYQGCNSNSS